MKHRKKHVQNQNSGEDSTFFLRCAIACAALVLAWSIKGIRPASAQVISRSMDAGLEWQEVVELFGRSVSSKEALHTLWQSGVVEVWQELKP